MACWTMKRGLTEADGCAGADHFRTYVNSWADSASTVMDYYAPEDSIEIQIEDNGYQDIDDFHIWNEDFDDGEEVLKVVGGRGLPVVDLDVSVVETVCN